MMAQYIKVAFVRHFHWLFKAIDILLPSITVYECGDLSNLIDYLTECKEFRERIELRQSSINAIRDRIAELSLQLEGGTERTALVSE